MTVSFAGPKKQEEHPRGPLLELLVDACMATKLVGFTPQDLSMVIHGEHRYVSVSLLRYQLAWP